jgi:hypothetical protein
MSRAAVQHVIALAAELSEDERSVVVYVLAHASRLSKIGCLPLGNDASTINVDKRLASATFACELLRANVWRISGSRRFLATPNFCYGAFLRRRIFCCRPLD